MPCSCTDKTPIVAPKSYAEAVALLEKVGLPNPYESPEAKAKFKAMGGTGKLCRCERAMAKAALKYLPGEGPSAKPSSAPAKE